MCRKRLHNIRWGYWPQFQRQVPSRLPENQLMDNLSILPTCGTKFYQYKSGWTKLYLEDFTPTEQEKIIFNVSEAGCTPEKFLGELLENTGSQITYSDLGQTAPLDAKKNWNRQFQKWKKSLDKSLTEFSINIGGATSIDIT